MRVAVALMTLASAAADRLLPLSANISPAGLSDNALLSVFDWIKGLT